MCMVVKMRTGGSSVWMQSLVDVFRMYRIRTTRDINSFQRFSPTIHRFGGRDYSQTGQGLKLISSVNAGNNISHGPNDPMSQPSTPKTGFNFPIWARWVLGSVLSVLFPFWSKKMQTLKRIEGEVEMAVEGAEAVAEMVETVANATEKMTEELAEKLPENGKLKEAALAVEHISQVAAHEAHLTHEFLLKVDELKQDLDDLEAMVERVPDKIVGDGKAKRFKEDATTTNGHILKRD
ncbi:PREDICTED: uncharacterized protein LOC104804411 [Tarenaya hassleriana]|uniref:uncharacterized protein LOC104804411 n=1 Tax=Tarenaya hassleriana TaxID=28532 RepID=UPI00053C9F44|nr:PREDICTED: uncharacterized protein LOC104804411 [Tarenaya hassleriana]